MDEAKARILMVDDERRILDVYSLMLRDEGYPVWTAATPDDALTIVSREYINIVFLDFFLGPMTGLELMGRMCKVRSDMAYVIVTANGSSDLVAEAFRQGASDFLTKPFLVTDLIKSIERVNKKRDLQQQKKSGSPR